MTLIFRTGDSKRYKHVRGSKHRTKKPKPFQICRDYETLKRYELARENALHTYNAYNAEKMNDEWKNVMIDIAQTSQKKKISIWRAAFERTIEVMNHKICELVHQLKESDRKAQVMNAGFYDKVDNLHQKFYNDLAAMRNESEKRNVGFMKKANTQKFVNDLSTLTKENQKRNAGFHHCNKSDHENKFKKMCLESQNRNNMYFQKRKNLELDRMKMMNEQRTASFMVQRPDSKFDAVMSMNDKRTSGFISKKPVTKLQEISKWNDQRNAVFHLHA